MLFSELALEGVRNFEQMRRIRMGTGMSVYLGGPKSGKSTLVELVLYLLYPDPIEPTTEVFRSLRDGPCRVLLVMDDQKSGRFRLAKDLISGRITLSKWDASSSSFTPVSSNPAEILQYLGGQLGLVQQDIFEKLYVFRDDDLPSSIAKGNDLNIASEQSASAGSNNRNVSSIAAASKPSKNIQGFPGYQGLDPEQDVLPDDPSEIQSQLDILKRDLAMARNVDDWQFQLDGLQGKMFELDDKLKSVKQMTLEVKQLEEKLQPFSTLNEMPANFEKRVRSYEKEQEKLSRDSARLDEDVKKWENLVDESINVSIWSNKIFLWGLLIGTLALFSGIAGFICLEWLRYFALFDLVGFAMVVVAVFQHLEDQTSQECNIARLKLAEERKAKLLREFELATTLVRKTLTETETESPAQLIELYNQRNKIVQQLEQAQQQLETKRQQEGVELIESNRQILQKQIDEMEHKLADAGGLMMSPSEMERRIGSLTEKLQAIRSTPAQEYGQKIESPGHGQLTGFDTGAPPGAALRQVFKQGVSIENSVAVSNPCEILIEKARDLLLAEWDRILPVLEKRIGQYFSALTERAYSRVILQDSGSIECVDASGSSVVSFANLPASVQDLVYVSLLFSLVEASVTSVAHPLLLDDPFHRISSKLHELLGKMLAGIGKKTQVIFFTSQPQWAQHTKASFRL